MHTSFLNEITCKVSAKDCFINLKKALIYIPCSPVENQNGLELDFKVFSLLILVVQTLYLMNPTNAILESLSVLKY